MPSRRRVLQAKYPDELHDNPPDCIDESNWRLFIAHVRDGQTLVSLSASKGWSTARVARAISQVDHELENSRLRRQGLTSTLDAPIEYLKLSTRARHILRGMGCHTIRMLIEHDFGRATRGLGMHTRQEIHAALRGCGFEVPPGLQQVFQPSELVEEVRGLRERTEAVYRSWRDQLDRLEQRIRKYGGRESSH